MLWDGQFFNFSDRNDWSGTLRLQGSQHDPCHLRGIHTKEGCEDLSTFPQLYSVTSTGTVCAPVSHDTTEQELRIVFK